MKKPTKSGNSLGNKGKSGTLNEYFANAAKQIPWTVNVNEVTFKGKKREERYIDVPASDWEKAMDNLTVCHLVKQHGFVLQDCIPYQTKEVFNPEITLKERLKPNEVKEEFPPGLILKLRSDGTRFEIVTNNSQGIMVKYPDGQKMPFKCTRDIIKRNLALGVWVRT